ncbi:MAG: lipopolysaccharide heptosyltransferase II [Vulcanimicrobiota bacterium]
MKRLLVVHTGGGLGDVLLSTPLVRELRKAHPQAEIDFLARRSTAAVLRRNPDIHELLELPGKAPKMPGEMLELASKLRQRNYDAALILWSVTGLAWTLFLARIPRRVGQDSRLGYSFLYTHKVRVRSEHGDDQTHWTEILLDYGRALGLEPTDPKVVYEVDPAAREKARQLLQDSPGEGPLVGFHTGKGMPLTSQRWPVDAFAAWARQLVLELPGRLVLTGGPDEVELVAAVQKRLGVPCLNLAGQTDLDTLAAVAEQCRVFVCPDSGPMHLAAAVGTPVVGIYALDEDFPRRWAPFGTRHRIIRPQNRNCRPGCLKATCPDFRCYRQVQADEIVKAARELLEES